MAESEDDVLSIKVVGDFSEFDEGIKQREGISPRAVLGAVGGATFANETGVRQSPALSYASLGIPDSSRFALPSVGQGTANGGIDATARAFQGATDRMVAAFERAMSAMGVSGFGASGSGRVFSFPGPTQGALPYYSQGGAGGLVRYQPPVQRGGGEDEVIDAEYEPASQLAPYGGGGGSGGGQRALPGPSGMTPPYGPQNANGRVGNGWNGGGGGWWNGPGPGFSPRNRPNPGGVPWWQQSLVGTRMFYTTMFGLYEVGKALEASDEGQINAAIAQDPLQLLQARVETVHRESSGILGSIGGLGLNILHAGGWNVEAPYAVNRDLLLEEGRYRSQQTTGTLAFGVRDARSIRESIPQGQTRAANVQDEVSWGIKEREMNTRIGFLNSQLGATESNFYLTKPGEIPGHFGYVQEPLVKGELRGAYQNEVTALRQSVQDGREMVQFKADERAKDLQHADLALRNRGRDAIDQTTLAPDQAALTALSRQQNLEYAETLRKNPELAETLYKTQTQEYDSMKARIGQSEASSDIGSAGRVTADRLLADRRPYDAARSLMLSNYSAAIASPGVVNDPEAQARLTNELIASMNLQKSQHDFEMQGTIHDFKSETAANRFQLADDPLNAQKERILGAGERERRLVPKDSDPKIIEEIDKNTRSQLDLADKRDQTSQGLQNLQLVGRMRQIQDLFNRNPAGAAADAVATSTQEQIVGLRQQGHDTQAFAAANVGVQAIQLQRRDYLEAFRGTQLDLRDFRTNNPRDQENPGAVMKSMDEAIKMIGETLAGNNQTFFDKIGQAILGVVAK